MKRLTATLRGQKAEGAKLDAAIAANVKELGYAGDRAPHLPSRFGDLPPRWLWLRLDDGCEGVFDCPHSTPKLANSGPLIVRSQDIITGVLRAEQAACVSEETYKDRTSRVVPTRGDILYSREGTYFGIAAEVPEHTRLCLGQRMVLIRPKAGVIDFRFLCHWLNSPVMASHIHGYRDGSVAERLNLPTIRALPVLVPPLPEQRAIAHILGTLDNKIELNRRMNETLETMARALFKSWFVDFDPVRAKHALSKVEGVESRPSTSSGQAFPGLPKPLADLFPASFEDSEMGEIPKGWKVEPLSEITTTITKGTTPTQADSSTADKGDGRINYVRVNSIGEDGAVLFDKLIKIPKSVHLGVLKRSILQANDVLYTIAGTIGRTAIVDESLLPANTNQAVAVVRPKQAIPAIFLAMTMQESTFREELHSNIVQAVQANLSLGTLSRARTVIPPRDTLVELFMPIADFAKRVASSRSESRALAALRDTLLPKLISGELRVNAAELISGAVM